MGKPRKFLGLTVMYVPVVIIHLSQSDLVQATILNANMQDFNPLKTPYHNAYVVFPTHIGYTPTPHHHYKYLQLMCYLRFLAYIMRPDLSLITVELGAALKNPTERHLSALKVVMHYLQHNIYRGILYESFQPKITGSPTTTILYGFLLCGGPDGHKFHPRQANKLQHKPGGIVFS